MKEDYCAGTTVVNDASSSSREFGLDNGIREETIQSLVNGWSVIDQLDKVEGMILV